MKTLDITDFKEHGEELITAINNAVKDTQRVIIQELPSELQMTQAQYIELMNLSGLVPMHNSEDQMYITPDNVMEVKVKL